MEASIYFRGIWPGQLIGEKYRVKGAIGEGGMGIVLRAQHSDLNRIVAVKVMRAELAENEEVVERMLFEARAAAMLRSEHVARVLDVGRLENGVPYIVMEYLEGEDLQVAIARYRRLHLPFAVDFVLQACEAVAEAHAHGIVHRDLKPENLFLTTHADGEPCIKVLDFGISKQRDVERRHQTNPTTALGSPHYMAPEQMRGREPVDSRADIWSLGAMLYEFVTGRQPFEAETLARACVRVLNDDPTPPRFLVPELPTAFEEVLLRCLQKSPDERFSDVSELAYALAPFGGDDAQSYARRICRVQHGSASLPETSRCRPPRSDAQSQPSLVPAILTQRVDGKLPARGAITIGALIAALGVLGALGLIAHSRSKVSGLTHAATGPPAAATLETPTKPRAVKVSPQLATPIVVKAEAAAVPETARPTARSEKRAQSASAPSSKPWARSERSVPSSAASTTPSGAGDPDPFAKRN